MGQIVNIGGALLCHLDCREAFSLVDKVDAIVTDPPYGIREAKGKNKTRGNKATAKDYGKKDWDDAPIASDLLDVFINSGKPVIMFGGNYYPVPPSSCWLVWDKENTGDFADCELIWTNLKKAVRKIRYRWNGMIRANREPRGDHPTQKPVGVMQWCLSHLPKDTKIILDPFMGSGTTGVAAVSMGFKFIGIEKDEEYFNAACRRIKEAVDNPSPLLYLKHV